MSSPCNSSRKCLSGPASSLRGSSTATMLAILGSCPVTRHPTNLLFAGDHPLGVCEGDGLGPIGHARLVEDIAYVPCDGVHADDQLRGDLSIGASGGDESQHLQLASGEAARNRAGPARLAAPIQTDQPGVACMVSAIDVLRCLKFALRKCVLAGPAQSATPEQQGLGSAPREALVAEDLDAASEVLLANDERPFRQRNRGLGQRQLTGQSPPVVTIGHDAAGGLGVAARFLEPT